MKKIILIVCLVIGTAVCAKAQEPLFYHRHGGIEAEQRTTGFSGTGANIDVLYHRVFWRINPDSTKYIRGWVQTNFRTTQASVSSISMDMHAVLIVDSVRFRNSRLPSANITRSGNIVTIALGVTLADNFIDSFTIFYRGVPPAVSGAAQGYQRITSVAGAGNYINTLSESYEDRDWWPCKADMQDKVDSMDITVSVPWGTPTAADTFWVACNGKLVDSTIIGGSRFFTFKTRYPIATYLVAINVARYNRYYRSINLNGTIIPVVYNLLQGKTATAYNNILTAMDRMNTLLVAFSQLFGDYPFKLEKHGYYDGLQGAAGMEHQTFSAMSPNSLTSASVLAHELIHQWFGDNVTFATWNELWLAEGFARYGEALAGELVPATGINPTTARSNIKSAALGQTTTGCWIPNSSIANSNLIWGGSYSSTTYNRGAMVISMLRSLCGDAKFYEILTKFQRDLTGKSATTDTLKRFFNEGLGVDLTPFFNDYVGGSGNGVTPVGGIGHPTNTIAWNTPSPNKLVVQVASQTRSSGTNVAYFRGPVVLRVTGLAPGQDTLITFMDWGGGNLSYAGNGISLPVAGNRLSYYLSFTPATVTYDDGARTMTNGSTTFNSSLDGYIWFGTNSTAWNTAGNWRANEVPPSGADITIATTGSNQPILPGSITVGPLNILANNTVILNGHTLTLNNTVRGTGTFTGSPTSNLVVAGAAGTLNFNQATVSSRSLNNLTLNGRSSAALAPGELNVLGALTATGTNLDVRTATVKVGN